jgi:hypothetical protein
VSNYIFDDREMQYEDESLDDESEDRILESEEQYHTLNDQGGIFRDNLAKEM